VNFEAKNETSFVVCQNDTKDIRGELTYTTNVTYSGEGISASGIFDGKTVTPGNTYVVTATRIFDNGTSTIDFTIEIPEIGFTFDPLPILCADASPLDLQPFTSKSTTFAGTGVNGTLIEPVNAGAGTHPITAQFNSNGCLNTITEDITIVPSFVIDAGANLDVCANGPSTSLNTPDVTPPGGVWDGPNATPAGILTPEGLAPDSYTHVYTLIKMAV